MGVACRVVPQAGIPLTGVAVATIPAELVQFEPLPPVPVRVANSFTVTEVGTAPVKVFTMRSRFTPRFTVSSGVIRQEQHETSSSPGSNANTLTQMLPDTPPKPGPSNGAPLARVLTTSMYDSPDCKLDAYQT